MKSFGVFWSIIIFFLLESLHAHGISRSIGAIRRRIEERSTKARQANNADPLEDPGVLIGDIKDGGTTRVGKSIARIITATETGQSNIGNYRPPPLDSYACRRETCCVWSHLSQVLSLEFLGPCGRCNKWARAAIRLGFHDASGWSTFGPDYGGADGSIVLSEEELNRQENDGLQDIAKKMRMWARTYKVGMADLIQFAATHAVVSCPLGPRVRFFVGRKDSHVPAPEGRMPNVDDTADNLINLFEAKTITPHNLVALLGAHSTSEQFFVDKTRAGAPQDSTPGVWDVLFYNETLGPTPYNVLRFPSDIKISQDPRASGEWIKFAGPGGQDDWNEDFSYSMIRLSILGVYQVNQMTECTQVLPMKKRNYNEIGIALLEEEAPPEADEGPDVSEEKDPAAADPEEAVPPEE